MQQGKFITLEGGEGTGKTTQAALLAKTLEQAGIPVLLLRSPGGTAVAEQLRTILKTKTPGEDLLPETELLLFGACHSQMCEYAVKPALAEGKWVICDRFFDSTTVYQGYVRGLPLETVERINQFACRTIEPDLTLLLDIEPELGVRRACGRNGGTIDENDRFDSEGMAFHKAIRDSFLERAKCFPERFRILSAAGTIEEISADIKKAVSDEFGLGII
ncbi:MAG: dTMP kinase [Lentisphaeria bacterium]|nr:dTMP kinase [Lentisphaeria bacterium]